MLRPTALAGIGQAALGIDLSGGGSIMNDFNCTLCKMALNLMSSAVFAAVMIRLASAYRYVQVFV
jgi:hypothetical protein